MAAIRLAGFDGLVPRMSPTLIGDAFSQIATNVKLYAKELRHWRGPALAYSPPMPPVGEQYKTVYRLFHSDGSTAFLLWKTDVNVAVSPTAESIPGESRIYYTGDGEPKKTNWEMAVGATEPYPSAWMPMGVTPPQTGDPGEEVPAKPSLTKITAGTGTIETRSYVYTNISEFGDVTAESAPSDAASIEVETVGSIVRVYGFVAPEADENVTHRRIYRTVVGATTVTYQFVEEIPVAQASYDDAKTVAQLGEILATDTWLPPPKDLAGLVVLPGGSLVGYTANTVHFSVPHMPHAWPPEFDITLPVMKIVGLAVVGSSVVAMTGTNPYFIHGGFPGEMYVEKIPLQEPCVAATTIASDEDGVVYASPNGLVLISPGDRGLVTTNLFTADEWRPLIPQTMKATILQGRYFGVFPGREPTLAIVLSRIDPPALSHVQLPACALHTDARNGFLFYVNEVDQKVYQMDANDDVPLQYQWRSKRFVFEQGNTYSLLRLDANYSQLSDASASEAEREEIVAYNEAHFAQDLMGSINSTPINAFDAKDPDKFGVSINGSILKELPRTVSARRVQIILYGDDDNLDGNLDQRVTLEPKSLRAIRIPAFKSRELEVEIVGNIDVVSLHMATTLEELRGS